MPALSFQQRFVPMIVAGDKEHTIRAERARLFRVGDVLSLYTGMRTKQCRLLMRRTCTMVRSIQITEGQNVIIDGEFLSFDEREQLAVKDGFRDFAHMMEFWEGRLPFKGRIIHWRFNEEVRA